ncbi:Hypothetical protein PHPALM_19680 [Phytophthora palmivora]|uniref:MULE transposase domain-containing protein n=1 Tax=Phytophthora palmivora TaxID=4796 RepID=A0A2P4XGU4_9STRA|nr:Hypothetical protein PHPALM_19680 [Phytophthora palmivora]
MIKAVKNQFPESRIVGCLFHFKQAIRRKMLKLKIPTDEVDLAMRPGCINKLTVIRRCEISNRGIRDVRAIIKRDCENENIWWNIYGLREDIVNRTNNTLERYNRTLNDAFSVPHPDVSRDNVRLINDISNRRARAPSHASPQRAPRFDSDYQLEMESESDLADSDDSNSDSGSVVSPIENDCDQEIIVAKRFCEIARSQESSCTLRPNCRLTEGVLRSSVKFLDLTLCTRRWD